LIQPCVSTTAVSSDIEFDNGVYLVGKDLCQIKKDCQFAKVVFIQTEDMQDDDVAFNTIKDLEGMCYRFSLDGFMTRSSALNMREQIRVSKKAIKNKLSFGDYGKALVEEYLKNPAVKSVQIYFVTGIVDFDILSKNAQKIKETTSALNHILDNILFDCSSCKLKDLCDEVEGMKELHMKNSKK
jgi:CO dehydrogenase/acetyl-CoA synthase beta subunit